jgi:GNAT superfamily N-acetyltransferase
MVPHVHDERYLAEAAREMVQSFRAKRFQHVVALFDQLMQRQAGMEPGKLLDQLAAAGGKSLPRVLTRSYAYDSCWFCDTGMATCETCDGKGLVEGELFCVDCHGLGKIRCTVCHGASFVILEEVPEFFRGPVATERLNLAERAFGDTWEKFEALRSSRQWSGSLARKLHHQCQQVLGLLHNLRAWITRQGNEEQVSKFNSMVGGVQRTYHELTAMCARGGCEAAGRLLEGEHGDPGRPGESKLTRSVEHHLAIARGYVDILARAGLREQVEELTSEIQGLERRLRGEHVRRMVVPVGPAAEKPAPEPAPKARASRAEAETKAMVEFAEELSEEQIAEIAELFESEYWTRDRTLEQVRRMVAASTINIAVVRSEGKDQRVVGYVRALSDGVFKAVVCDFVVAKTSRGAGLGKLLMSRLMSHRLMSEVKHVEVACLPEAVSTFKQWGFSESADGLVLLRYVRPGR